MRSYGQYCALARALDVVGERWTLLIIRELFARDSRYADLRDGLPGIATNLLADRLRQLQSDGIVEAYHAPRPVGTTVYRLTRRGRELAPAVRALAEWGLPLAGAGQGGDAFRTHWLTLMVPIFFEGADLADLWPLTIMVRTGDEPATIEVSGDGVTVYPGTSAAADAVVVEGAPEDVSALLSGTAVPEGIRIRGPREAVGRLHTLTARSRVGVTPAAGAT